MLNSWIGKQEILEPGKYNWMLVCTYGLLMTPRVGHNM